MDARERAYAGNPRLRVPGERSETRDPESPSVALGPRNGVPATRASRGAPRGDERKGRYDSALKLTAVRVTRRSRIISAPMITMTRPALSAPRSCDQSSTLASSSTPRSSAA